MKKLLTYYFCFSILIGSTIYLCNQFEIQLPKFVRFYINDFLIVPIILYVCLFAFQKIQGKKNMLLSLLNILYVCVMYSVVFEYWLPKFHSRYTGDFVDVGLYFLSGFLFYFLQKMN
jgi:hypothetical protein